MSEDELRDALADVLRRHHGQPSHPVEQYHREADVLLPVVVAYAREFAAAALRAAAQEQRNEAENVPDTDQSTHADGHRCAADFIDRRANALATKS